MHINMPMCTSCRGRGLGDPASEPMFSVVPAIMLGKNVYIWGQAPVSKTKSLHRLTEPHILFSCNYIMFTHFIAEQTHISHQNGYTFHNGADTHIRVSEFP